MCGRFSLAPDISQLQQRFHLQAEELAYTARYNIAPTQEVLTVVNDGVGNRAWYMTWGLIPSWAREPDIGRRMINARAETVAQRPAFRQAFLKRRCLVIADGFYEWMSLGKSRVPMRIILGSGEPFGFAGLWELWRAPNGQRVQSCTIITTAPNGVMEHIHNRMPVILPAEAEARWLESTNTDTAALRGLLVSYAAGDMEAYKVSPLVNSPANDHPDCIARVGAT